VYSATMGFNRRKIEDQRRQVAEKEAANRRATDAQVLEDAERLIAAWNERQALRAPMIFSPTTLKSTTCKTTQRRLATWRRAAPPKATCSWP
jgi:hypothetical protein